MSDMPRVTSGASVYPTFRLSLVAEFKKETFEYLIDASNPDLCFATYQKESGDVVKTELELAQWDSHDVFEFLETLSSSTYDDHRALFYGVSINH